MDIGMIRGLGTVVVMVAFIGLALWVFSPKRKSEFDDARPIKATITTTVPRQRIIPISMQITVCF